MPKRNSLKHALEYFIVRGYLYTLNHKKICAQYRSIDRSQQNSLQKYFHPQYIDLTARYCGLETQNIRVVFGVADMFRLYDQS